MEKAPITALFDSSLTYVRCAVCIASKGRLSSGKNPTESAFKVPYGTQQILVKNIATFLKKPECEIAVVTSGPYPPASQMYLHRVGIEYNFSTVILDCMALTLLWFVYL